MNMKGQGNPYVQYSNPYVAQIAPDVGDVNFFYRKKAEAFLLPPLAKKGKKAPFGNVG